MFKNLILIKNLILSRYLKLNHGLWNSILKWGLKDPLALKLKSHIKLKDVFTRIIDYLMFEFKNLNVKPCPLITEIAFLKKKKISWDFITRIIFCRRKNLFFVSVIMNFFADQFRIMKINFWLRDTLHPKSTKYGRPFSVPNIFNNEIQSLLTDMVAKAIKG